jgi:hypothetical protein
MARERAGAAARAAFARVGTASVEELPVSDAAGDDVGIIASGNDSGPAIMEDVISGSPGTGGNAGAGAGGPAVRQAARKAGKNAGKRRRRVGRPRGPERVPLTVRILTAVDERLTAAVEATGKSPQYIVDEALGEYLKRLGF